MVCCFHITQLRFEAEHTHTVISVCCMITIYHRHKESNKLQEPTDSDSFTSDCLIPIIGLTIFKLLSATPLFTFTLVLGITSRFEPWVSWDYIHELYLFIPVYPSVVWRNDTVGNQTSDGKMDRHHLWDCLVFVPRDDKTGKEALCCCIYSIDRSFWERIGDKHRQGKVCIHLTVLSVLDDNYFIVV